MPKHRLDFSPYELDLDTHDLWRAGRQIHLRPKDFGVLRYLVEHSDQVVTKQELLQAVWPGIAVSEHVLRASILALRKALGDTTKPWQVIQSVRGTGYRFLRPVLQAGQRYQPSFVGRETELEQLETSFRQASAGQRQVMFVQGEPGVGKTALLNVFVQGLRLRQAVAIVQGQCVATYGSGTAYYPVLSALEAWHRAAEQADGQRLITALARYAPSWLVQLPSLVSPTEYDRLRQRQPEATQEQMLLHMGNALDTFATQRVLVLVLEDLHWSDSSTLDLIATIAHRDRSARLLILGTYRPHELSVRPSPLPTFVHDFKSRGVAQELTLTGLTAAAVATYFASRFPNQPFPEALALAVQSRTEGNPLFLVNIVQALVDEEKLVRRNGRWEVTGQLSEMLAGIPEQLQAFLTHLLERLSQTEQEVLEVASVAGDKFSAATVAAASKILDVEDVEQCCEQLVRGGQFLERVADARWPDGTRTAQYRFGHTLYQEVAYTRLPPARRQGLHRRIGERLAAGYGEHSQEIAAELAVHFEQGGDYQRAVRYQQLAAENALKRSASREAYEHALKGHQLLAYLPETPDRVLYELPILLTYVSEGLINGLSPKEAEQAFTRAQELGRRTDLSPVLLPAIASLATSTFTRAQYTDALRFGERCMTWARHANDPTLLSVGGSAVVFPLFYRGEHLRVREIVNAVTAEEGVLQDDPMTRVMGLHSSVMCRSTLPWTLWALGYPDQARQRSREILAAVQGEFHVASCVMALNFAALLQHLCRDSKTCLSYTDELVALTRDYRLAYWEAMQKAWAGWARAEQGQPEQGLQLIHEGFSFYKTYGVEFSYTWFAMLLAEAYRRAGQRTEGLQTIESGLARVHEVGEYVWEAELYRLKGELLQLKPQGRRKRRQGSGEEAEVCFGQAIEIARGQEARSLELRAAMSLARLWKQQEKKSEAHQLLAPVYAWFTEGFDTPDLQDAKALIAELA